MNEFNSLICICESDWFPLVYIKNYENDYFNKLDFFARKQVEERIQKDGKESFMKYYKYNYHINKQELNNFFFKF